MPSLIKISIFLSVWLILWLPLAIILAKPLNWQLGQPPTIAQKLPLIAALYILVPFLVWGTIQIEGVSLANYGFVWQFPLLISLLQGLIVGIVGIGIIFLIEGFLGWIQWQKNNFTRIWSIFLPLLALGLWVGGTEELIFRGIVLTQLRQDYSLWVAAILSSAIFAILHLIWERQETTSQLPGLWLMGMILVGARIVDQNALGLAWGLHSGWVWGLAILDSAQLISYTGKVSAWLTGLFNNPLAGLAGIVCLLGTGVGLWGFFRG